MVGEFRARRWPVLPVEPAENIGGGAPGDCTDVLRALVRHKPTCAGAIVADPRQSQSDSTFLSAGDAVIPSKDGELSRSGADRPRVGPRLVP